jgi:erythronate-4-phosphate dehydrogenase
MSMTIVVDENIPFAAEALGGLGEIRSMSGRAITREALAGADALVVRSITPVGRELLEGTPVRFVGTATNGIDHVDVDYLESAGIAFAAAVASNANAVAEYVIAALLELRSRGLASPAGARLGVVGMGAIGGLVAPRGVALGMEVVEYDPPRALADPGFRSASFDDLFSCDIITFHVPLIDDGEHPTRHMVDGPFLRRLRPGTILINTSRGGVVDSAALLEALWSGRIGGAVLDVWEGEPAVPVELVEAVTIASPHIGAYSIDAKLRGTEMMARALAAFAGSELRWSAAHVLPERGGAIELPDGIAPLDAAATAVRAAYDITLDDAAVRSLLTLDDAGRRGGFDLLRKNYRERREFPAYEVVSGDPALGDLLSSLGFPVRSRNGS